MVYFMHLEQENVCGYCNGTQRLERLRNSRMVAFVQGLNSNFTRRTVFCEICRPRIARKVQSLIQKAIREGRREQSSVDDRTSSYSNASSHPGKYDLFAIHFMYTQNVR